MAEHEAILNFWFGKTQTNKDFFPNDKVSLWFKKDDSVDKSIRDNFGDLIEKAAKGELDSWTKGKEKTLALFLLLDQFPRNIYRNQKKAFATDKLAQSHALSLLEKGKDKDYNHYERIFLYLPLEHAEDVALQSMCVQYFRELLEDAPKFLKKTYESFLHYAQKHQEVIDKFGRFPHRNDILQRESTKEEREFLKEPGSSF